MPGIVPSDEPLALNLVRIEGVEQSAMEHVKSVSCPDNVRVTFRQAFGYDIVAVSAVSYFPCKTVGGFIFEVLQFVDSVQAVEEVSLFLGGFCT